MPAAGSRPDRLAGVRPQERILRRTVEQIDDSVPVVPLLHTFVPQMVDQLVEVLRLIDTGVPEQVIDVPKITAQDVIPQHAVLHAPQMVDQLVTHALLRDCLGRVEEEEEEEQPSVIPESYFRDAAGRAWCRVSGPAGGILVDDRHIICPVDPSGGVHRQARAENKHCRRGDSGG